MRHRLINIATIVLVAAACAACAPEIVRQAIPYVQKTGAPEVMQLTKSVKVPNWSGTGNSLFVGTRWDYVGEVSHGRAYRSKDSVFFLQGANSHEAYLVVKDKKLVGFYLPGEKSWSALETALDIEFSVNN